jgi:hypothetical protein
MCGHSLKKGQPLSYPLPYAGRGTITNGRG